jgi:hypothetical protein
MDVIAKHPHVYAWRPGSRAAHEEDAECTRRLRHALKVVDERADGWVLSEPNPARQELIADRPCTPSLRGRVGVLQGRFGVLAGATGIGRQMHDLRQRVDGTRDNRISCTVPDIAHSLAAPVLLLPADLGADTVITRQCNGASQAYALVAGLDMQACWGRTVAGRAEAAMKAGWFSARRVEVVDLSAEDAHERTDARYEFRPASNARVNALVFWVYYRLAPRGDLRVLAYPYGAGPKERGRVFTEYSTSLNDFWPQGFHSHNLVLPFAREVHIGAGDHLALHMVVDPSSLLPTYDMHVEAVRAPGLVMRGTRETLFRGVGMDFKFD